MRNILPKEVEANRIGGEPGTGCYGAFSLVHPETGRRLQIVVSDGRDWNAEGLTGEPWEHASVSTPYGVPLYSEMKWVKSVFFKDEECCVEYHVPSADHLNIHPNVLHLWRCPTLPFPMPPKECV